jgi:dGTPase
MEENMVICQGNLSINLEEDTDGLKREIEQLKKLKEEVINSPAYVLLDGKTMLDQNDKRNIRSRLDHTNNVASIAKKIMGRIYDLCCAEEISNTEIFKLNKEKAELYTEITSLAHDLGHTPFGHAGESILNEFMQSINDKKVIKKIILKRKECFGEEYEEKQGHTEDFEGNLSFEHNEQSALEFNKIVMNSKEQFDCIDTNKIITGILTHSISRYPETPEDLMAQIVRQTDKIEYKNKDYEEVMQYIKFKENEEDIKQYQSLPVEERIEDIIQNISCEAVLKGKIDDDNDSLKMLNKLRKKYETCVYLIDKDGKRGLLTGNNRERQQMIYKKLLEYYYRNPKKIPTKSLSYNSPINPDKNGKRIKSFDKKMLQNDDVLELAVDYVNTFTNAKCYKIYLKLVKERIMCGEGNGIEPITEHDIEQRKKVQMKEQIHKIMAKDICSGIEKHTKKEYISILNISTQKFINNDLTEEARKKIEATREIHQKENEEDYMLETLLQEYDSKRKDAKFKHIQQLLKIESNPKVNSDEELQK